MYKQFEINQKKGGCQSGRKVVIHNSKSDLTLEHDVFHISVTFYEGFFPEKKSKLEEKKIQ